MTVLGDCGKAQVNQSLLDILTAAGIGEVDAKELARIDAFGMQPPITWLAGLKAAAALLNKSSVVLDWGTLPAPWDTLCSKLSNCNGNPPHEILVSEINGFSTDIQIALINAIGALSTIQANEATASRRSTIDQGPNAVRAAAVQQLATYLVPVDPDLMKIVQTLLIRKEDKDKRRKKAGEQVLEWLSNHGKFVMTPVSDGKYYLFRDTHKLFNLDSDYWGAWLYRLSGSNPASTNFRYIAADCRAAAYDGERAQVCRVAHWDGDFLRVSRFDGTVYRLDGQTIETECNGDSPMIFEDHPAWSAYEPDFSSNGQTLDWWVGLLNCDDRSSEYRLALKVWLLATFFIELCPTQVLLLLKGEAGSGKSMTLRTLIKLIFGPSAQISGVPDKPDGFTAIASHSHLLVLDNMDQVTDWLKDKLARITTGGVDHYRTLYTGNDLGTVIYRCWVAITARTPETLKRDDLADRLLILPVARIEADHRVRESKFLLDTLHKRSCWWGDVLMALNQIVAVIRRSGLPAQSVMRMADFEALGRVIATAIGQERIWERVVKDWIASQSQLLLESDEITEALDIWLKTPANCSRRVDTRTLYSELTLTLYGPNRPDRSWPRSVRSFGWKLKSVRRALQTRYKVQWQDVSTRTYYIFDELIP